MAGLDINYLDAVRDCLYNKKTKQENAKKRKKPNLKPSLGGPLPEKLKSKKDRKNKLADTQEETPQKPHCETKLPDREPVKFKTSKTKNTETLKKEEVKQSTTPKHNFYDDPSVTVKGLTFSKLCSPFRTTKQLNTNFVIPKKHLVSSPEPIKPPEVEEEVVETPRKLNQIILPDCMIIIIDFDQTVYFNGAIVVKVLFGEIEVLGGVITAKDGEKPVYSPRGSSLLYLRNTTKKPNDKLQHFQLPNQELTFQEDCAVVQLKPVKNHSVNFLKRHISQKIFPEKNCDFELSGSFNRLQDCNQWKGVIKTIQGGSKVAICGGKGVGKSTFLRYCINSLLGRFDKVVVVDLDPGQSEFFPPGCLSIITVTEMVLGPNYTHLLTPDCAVLSHINVAHDLRKYFDAVKYLLERLSATALPVLVNFPGFTHGLGLDVAVKALKWLQPSRVIEIKGNAAQKNYVIDLKSKNVNPIRMLGENEDISISYEYTKLNSLVEKSGAWSLEARQAREFCVLTYFGRMTSETVRLLTSCDVAMFNISISALNFVNYDGSSISPLVVNANVVALCWTEPTGLYICQGFGYVRGLDLDNDTLVLLTPEPFERLCAVTHLVLSSVTTPPSLLMHTEEVKGRVPYVGFGALVDMGQLTKRPYLPPRK